MPSLKPLLLGATCFLATGAAAQAATLVGLVDGKTLVTIDTESLQVTGVAELSGADSLVGIDLRPSNKMLYGVTPDATIVTLDHATGMATPGVTLEQNLPAGVDAIVDFNPAADKLRFMGTDGTNLRADVDSGAVTVDGSLAFEGSDMHAGETPAIVAAAYINSYGKPEKTAMYDIDATIVALIQQVSPNDGVLKAIGKLGIDAAESYAFDVQTDADGANTAWLAAGGMLYWVDLETGMANPVGAIEGLPGTLTDITAMPAM